MAGRCETTSTPRFSIKHLIVAADVALLLILLNTLPFEPLVTKGLSLFLFIAVLWLTEALHVTITALLVPVLAALLNIQNFQSAVNHFANATIYLFFGGFALAAALRHQSLDKYLAARIIVVAKGDFRKAIWLLFAMTAFLSMWISNTATAAMMLPLGLGMMAHLDEDDTATRAFIMLGIAYSANIGGIGTLVGSPPNIIAAASSNITFRQWLFMGMPVVLILLPCALFILSWVLKPNLQGGVQIRQETMEWNTPRYLTLAIFGLTVIAWICSSVIASALGGLAHIDTLIAISAAVLICLTGIASWKAIEQHTEWGVLMLFGGGLALSAILKETGTSLFLANCITDWFGLSHPIILILSITTFIVFLTELASNTATAALMIPLFSGVAENLGISVFTISVIIAMAASCAFMLPVATPPNALVYASGQVPQRIMIKVGFLTNLVCILLLTLLGYYSG